MDTKLFISTFALIFLAELGDKTQLAAMATTASAQSGKWTVFLAASAALVLSTLIAVLFGQALTKVVPEYVIKTAAAILFIVFGLFILRDAFVSRAEAKGEPAAPTGALARVVLRVAADFEEATAADYRALADKEADRSLADLFASLAQDEERHLQALRQASDAHAEELVGAAETPPQTEHLKPDVSEKARSALEHALEHEKATAGFYRELARDTVFPELKRIFASLAEQEEQHVTRLEAFAGKKTVA